MTDIVKSEIVNQIYNENDKIFSKNDINDIINSFLGIITDELHKGNKVKIDSFGTFSSYERQPYVGKSINGNVMEIPISKYVSFKPSKKLKDI